MKKILSIFLIAILVFSQVQIIFADSNDVEDLIQIGKKIGKEVIENGKEVIEDIKQLTDIGLHWAKDYIKKLVNIGTINGYLDGSFKPDNTVTNAEFTKILLSSMEYKFENSESGHWSKNYIDKALSLGIIDEGDFKDLDDPITRGQMAKMIVRAIPTERIDNLEDYQNQIKDIDKMSAEMKYFVTTAYGLGIIKGYEDGTFRPNKTATRAEASTMIVRMLNKEERETPSLSRKWTHKEFVEFTKNRKKALKSVSLEYFEIAEEGKIRFTESEYVKQETIVDESKFPNLNKIVYNVIKDLTQSAYEGGYYVKAFYNKSEEVVIIDFYEEERVARGSHALNGDFGITLRVEPFKPYEETKDLSYVSINIGQLWRSKDIRDKGWEFIVNNNYRHSDFLKILKDMIYDVYGEKNGKLLYEYSLQEYSKEYETKGQRENYSLMNIGEIEVRNFNIKGINVHFTTNIDQ